MIDPPFPQLKLNERQMGSSGNGFGQFLCSGESWAAEKCRKSADKSPPVFCCCYFRSRLMADVGAEKGGGQVANFTVARELKTLFSCHLAKRTKLNPPGINLLDF